jgi:hypothetical protein
MNKENLIKTYEFEIVLDSSGLCEYLRVKAVNEKEAHDELYKIDSNYKHYKKHLYDITKFV